MGCIVSTCRRVYARNEVVALLTEEDTQSSNSSSESSYISSTGATRDGSVFSSPFYLSRRPSIRDYPWDLLAEANKKLELYRQQQEDENDDDDYEGEVEE